MLVSGGTVPESTRYTAAWCKQATTATSVRRSGLGHFGAGGQARPLAASAKREGSVLFVVPMSPRRGFWGLVWLVGMAVACGDSDNPGGAGGAGGAGAAGGSGGSGAGGAAAGGGGAGGNGGAGANGGSGGSILEGGSTEGGGGQGGTGGTGGDGGAGGGAGGTGGTGGGGEGGAPSGEIVRIAAANLTSGDNQSYTLGHGIRILQGIHADIILLQEFNYQSNTPAQLSALVTAICGAECVYARGPVAKIPNGVVSRYPIVDSGSWTDTQVANRDFVWARVDVPGDEDVLAISVHLLGSSSTKRAIEATNLVNLINAFPNRPAYVVLGGDFNTETRTETCISNFSAFFHTGEPYPVDTDGDGTTNTNRNKPYDWVLSNPSLQSRLVPSDLGQNVFVDGAVIDTRTYTPLSDISPALATDSSAPSMQHMAVVRDFAFE